MSDKPVGAVLVLGGGIAGMQSALDLAEGGFLVHLVTDEPSIGGKMAKLDKTFPTNECAMCLLGPKMSDTASHPNIRLHTLSKLAQVQGEAGNFSVTVRHAARFVNMEECTACGECEAVCPVTVADEFNQAMSERKAIYKLFPQAVPNKYLIDKRGEPPCRGTCPAGCNVQGYVALLAEGRFPEALEVTRRKMPFAGICGRICHHPCETACNRKDLDQPIAIAQLKRAAADFGWAEAEQKQLLTQVPSAPQLDANGQVRKVGIIGAGPGGLAAAKDLAELGYQVTVIDALAQAGGMLSACIPHYRLPQPVVQREIAAILALGIEFRPNTTVGVDVSLAELQQEFPALLLALGCQKGRSLALEGNDLTGVFSGIEFLRAVALGQYVAVGRKVVIVGGGNVAIDTARTALRLGANEVHIYYRRDRAAMPAHAWEVAEAEAEGVVLHTGWAPCKLVGQQGNLNGIHFQRSSAEGRGSLNLDTTQNLTVAADSVILAIGQDSDLSCLNGSGIATQHGKITVDALTYATAVAGIFACGDVVSGPASVVEAVGAAHAAAESIHRYLHGLDLAAGRDTAKSPLVDAPPKSTRIKVPRQVQKLMEPSVRAQSFAEVYSGYSREEAIAEARRCFNCGTCSECLQCVTACKKGAINHAALPTEEQLQVGAIILAPGYEVQAGELRGEYGYGIYPNVMTSLEFERLLSSTGPTASHVLRPSDGKVPRKIAFIQCVGSRTCSKGNAYCSSICCMYATKEALIAREHDAQIEPTIFYLDLRSYGKNFDKYVKAAREGGVRYIRTMISSVREDPVSGNLRLKYAQGEALREEEFDLVVLAVGVKPPRDAADLAKITNIELNEYGFAATNPLNPVLTSQPGIFAAGAFQGPRDIPETVINASAAAAAAATQLAAGRNQLITPKIYPPERDVRGEPARVGVFICRCGINIASIVDVPETLAYVQTLPGVVHAEEFLYTCSQDTIKHIQGVIEASRLNRVVVASCTIRTHQPLFRAALREAGLNQFLFEMANIRDQCSWVHRSEPALATQKAQDLIRMAVAKVKLHVPLQLTPIPVRPAALVLGGGIAGLTASLQLAQQGFKAYLVEREPVLGGGMRTLSCTEDGRDAQAYLDNVLNTVHAHPLIEVFTAGELVDFTGHQGHFTSTVKTPNGVRKLEHGVVLVATGGQPTEANPRYGRGRDRRIISLTELEAKLAAVAREQQGEQHAIAGEQHAIAGEQHVTAGEQLVTAGEQHATAGEVLGPWQEAVIVLCASAGSDLPYCSRTCCTQAISNAIRLKQHNPAGRVFVLYRDIRTYAFWERYYRLAREMGIIFLRYDGENLPQPQVGRNLSLTVPDLDAGIEWKLKPDIIALAQGFGPATGAQELGMMLKVPLNEDGFFMETHAKLGPMDFPSSGLFLCGGAHAPKFVSEAISQAQGAVARAATILAKSHLMVGGVVAAVTPEKCAACLTCVRVCPYSVPKIGPDMVATIDAVQCHGCGTCVGECPAKAIELQHYTDAQMLAKISAVKEVDQDV